MNHSFLGSTTSSQSRRRRGSRAGSQSRSQTGENFILRTAKSLHNQPFYVVALDSCTLLCLFISDARVATIAGSSQDLIFDCVLFSVLGLFVLDFVLQTAFRPTYVWSLYFFTDILSTLSLLVDLSMMQSFFELSPILFVVCTGLKELRVIRFIRVLQSKSLYAYLLRKCLGGDSSVRSSHGQGAEVAEPNNDDEEIERQLQAEKFMPSLNRVLRQNGLANENNRKEESRLRRKLTDVNTCRLGLLIVTCSIAFPLVSSNDDSVDASPFLVQELQLSLNLTESLEYFKQSLDDAIPNLSTDLSSLGWISSSTILPGGSSSLTDTCIDSTEYLFFISTLCPSSANRRSNELSHIRPTSPSPPYLELIVDERRRVQWQAILNILRTVFINLLMLIGCMIFDYDCARVILTPITSLISLLRRIRQDPLCANGLIDEQQRRAIALRESHSKWEALPWWRRITRRKPRVLNLDSEISVLEATVLKLGSLLTVGFGEIGAQAISLSLFDKNASSVLGKSRGRRVDAVFCYIAMGEFNTVTEILKEKTVLLFNRIAEIVHGIVDEYHGFISKNNAGGFLILWTPSEAAPRERISELAVVCACQVIAAVEKCPLLNTYREHPYLKQVIPGYKVRLHIALHWGTGIEAATETAFKLDATFLGNEVEFTKYMCAQATNIYSIGVILSESIAHNLSEDFKKKLLRHIDCVRVGSHSSNIYTIDLDVAGLSEPPHMNAAGKQSLRKRESVLVDRFKTKQAKLDRKGKKLGESGYTPLSEFRAQELSAMRKPHEAKKGMIFHHMFKKGYLNYAAGEWNVAKKALIQCMSLFDERVRHVIADVGTFTKEKLEHARKLGSIDGPSLALLRYMLEHTPVGSNHARLK